MDGKFFDLFADELGLANAVLGENAANLLPEGSQISLHMGKCGLAGGCICI